MPPLSLLSSLHPPACCAHWQVAAGGDPDGTLDFYAVHGYAIWDEPERDWLVNMFRRPKSYFQVADKPILVGEHWEQVRGLTRTCMLVVFTRNTLGYDVCVCVDVSVFSCKLERMPM